MIGSIIIRGLILIFGYAYPAYECYKTVERNRPDINDLRFWCQYWILVAGMTVLERIGDTFISWVPMYGEAKLAFFIYLWFPKTKGTAYVYDSFFRPYLERHETEIDRVLFELRTRVGDMVILYWQKASAYAQTRILDILQYIASQSADAKPQKQIRKTQEQSSSKEVVFENSKPDFAQHKHETTQTSSVAETSKVSGSSDEQAVKIDAESHPVTGKPQSEIIQEETPKVSNPRQRRVNSSL